MVDRYRTILYQYVQTLLDQQRRIEDDQSEAEGQHIVTAADLEEGPYSTLDRQTSIVSSLNKRTMPAK